MRSAQPTTIPAAASNHDARFLRATLAPCLPSAVRVRLGRCAIVRFRRAAAAAFLMLRRAACFLFVEAMSTSSTSIRPPPAPGLGTRYDCGLASLGRRTAAAGIAMLAAWSALQGPPTRYRDDAPMAARALGHYWLALFGAGLVLALAGAIASLATRRRGRVLATLGAAAMSLGNLSSALIGKGGEALGAAVVGALTVASLVVLWRESE